MIAKKWLFIGVGLIIVLGVILGFVFFRPEQPPAPAPPPVPAPPAPSPAPSPTPPIPPTPPPSPPPPVPPASEIYASSLDDLIGFWEGKVRLADLTGAGRTAAIEEALRHEGTKAVSTALEEEGYTLNQEKAKVIRVNFDDPEQPEVTIVSIPSNPGPGGSKAAIVVAMPTAGEPIYMGYMTNIGVVSGSGSVIVYPSFFIRTAYWIDGRIIWWQYWWYDSYNHPNWYYSWWYWHWEYYWDHDYPWYPWYTWYYSWFYWHSWWYWSTWWDF